MSENTFEDNFLDANIMVISKIDWDVRYDRIGKYMSNPNIRKHTSRRVFDEGIKVFERIMSKEESNIYEVEMMVNIALVYNR